MNPKLLYFSIALLLIVGGMAYMEIYADRSSFASARFSSNLEKLKHNWEQASTEKPRR